jgi:hypothetical protein
MPPPDAADRRAAVEHAAAALSAELSALAARWQAGEINDSQFKLSAAAAIKLGHVAAAAVAVGGKGNLTAAEKGHLGQKIAAQYKYLDSFAHGIADPAAYGKAQARAAMYGAAILGTYEAAARRDAIAGGMTQERRQLSASEHCGDCVAYAARGWQPIGTLPGIGQDCSCKASCRCSFEYRADPEGADDAPPPGGHRPRPRG